MEALAVPQLVNGVSEASQARLEAENEWVARVLENEESATNRKWIMTMKYMLKCSKLSILCYLSLMLILCVAVYFIMQSDTTLAKLIKLFIEIRSTMGHNVSNITDTNETGE